MKLFISRNFRKWREDRLNGAVSRDDQEFSKTGTVSLSKYAKRRVTLDIGFVSLVDAAPLFVALDNGFFRKHGLKVKLHREIGWASIWQKMIYGVLDAAHALCPMLFSSTLGLESIPTPCLTGIILSRGGCAITLSMELRKRGVHDATTLAFDIRKNQVFRTYTFATVYPHSAQTSLLYEWLTKAGIDPDRDIRLVTLPPNQMQRNLAAGNIDGFCAGEPWPSLAIAQGVGWSPATSADIHPGHPGKALMVKESFAEERHEEHIAMIAALVEACVYCDDPANRESISRSLSIASRLNCDASLISDCLSPEFDYGMGRVESMSNFLYFGRNGSTTPSASEVDWILDSIRIHQKDLPPYDTQAIGDRVVRSDLHDEALKRLGISNPKESSVAIHQTNF